jgi:hypothetical protein
MNRIDVVKQSLAAIEKNDYSKIRSNATAGTMFDGPVPEPVNLDGFINLQKALIDAMPDWKFNARDYQERGNSVICAVQISGTHTRTLSLPMIPHAVEATRKHVQLPQEHLEFTFEGDKISRIHVDPVKGGGVMGLLDQLGVKAMAH